MLKRIAILILLLTPSFLRGQSIVPVVGGIATVDASTCPSPAGPIACSFQITMTGTTTLSLINARGSLNLYFVNTGAFTLNWPSTVTSPPTVAASTTTLVSLNYNASLGSWFISSGSSSGGGITQVTTLPGTCTATSAVVQLTVAPFGEYLPQIMPGSSTCAYVISPQPGVGIFPTSYGAHADVEVVTDGTVTNGSNNVASGASDIAFTSADTGKDCFSTTGGGPVLGHVTGKLSMTEGTFTFVSAHAGTCSGTANANASGTNTNFFFWATNDTAAMTAAYTAATPASGPCNGLFLPAHLMLVTTNMGSNAAATCGINTTGNNEGFSIQGIGIQSSGFLMGPNFNFATQCTPNNACMFQAPGKNFTNFIIWGGERGDCPAAANGTTLLATNSDDHYLSLLLVGWCASNANASTTGVQSINAGYGGNLQFVIMDGFGSIGFNSSATSATGVTGSNFSDNGQFAFTCSGRIRSIGNFFGDTNQNTGDVQINSGCIMNSTGDSSYQASATNQILMTVNTGGRINLVNDQFFESASTTSSALLIEGGIVNCSFCNLSGGGGTGVDWGFGGASPGGTFNDWGGSKWWSGKVVTNGSTTLSTYNLGGNITMVGSGSGTCTSSATLGMFNLGENALATCTSTTVNLGQSAKAPGTVYGIQGIAGTGGVAGDVFQLTKNGTPVASFTATIGTGTNIIAFPVTVANFVQGDVLGCQLTTGAADTLANVKCILILNYQT
jgi:hypothetical protein